MGVNLSRVPHILFFVILLPFLSFLISYLFHKIFPNLPFWMETITPLCVYGILYLVFEEYLWRQNIFRIIGIVNVPDLRGRWKGHQRSSFKEKGLNHEIPSCLEISQTFSKIIVRACYERSQSESIVANFVRVNDEIYLFYIYDNEPNSLKSGTMQIHKGTVKIRYLSNENKLIGAYFNSIGNQGELNYNFEKYDLLGRYSKE